MCLRFGGLLLSPLLSSADGFSDKSSHSGQEAQNMESVPPGNPEIEDVETKVKKDKKSREQ